MTHLHGIVYIPTIYKQLYRWFVVLIWGSIECALAMKIGGEAKAHEISNTQKWFGQFLNSLGDIKIINIFNGVPKSKLRENNILM